MRKLFYIPLLLIILSCSKKANEATILQGDAFGTTYTIQFYANKSFEAEKGLDSVIYAINKSVSTYLPNSDISKINQGDSSVIVDEIFKDVYSISEEVNKITKGYFDPTIGVLRNAYGFGDVKPLNKIDSTTLDSLMKYVGFQKVQLTPQGTVKKEFPEIYLDFNAVAKGYGIDCIGRYLESQGVSNYLIELGGELLAKGKNIKKETGWIVGIESVNSELNDRTISSKIILQNQGMASSGNYRKYRVDSITGKRYVHTLNPLTGSAEKSDVTSATVVASTCAHADAYATSFMALGIEKSRAILKKLTNIEAYLTYDNENGKEEVFMTDGFKKLLK